MPSRNRRMNERRSIISHRIHFFLHFSPSFSPMTTSLGSMSTSCLQQRESYHHHPYMFHDPLSLSVQYAAHPSRHHTPCNPAAAHQQSHAQHGNYATPGSTGNANNVNSSSSSTGTTCSSLNWFSKKRKRFGIGQFTCRCLCHSMAAYPIFMPILFTQFLRRNNGWCFCSSSDFYTNGRS